MKALLGLTPAELEQVVGELGGKRFVATQMADWLYKKRVSSVEEMRNLPKNLRHALSERFVVGRAAPRDVQRSADGTVKYLFPTLSGDFLETVYIPDGKRATLCVSSQVGCKMRCAFCMTGRQGYVASATVADILNQIYSLPDFDALTNIVFMGQGEPFDNLDNVLRATEVLTSQWGMAWSPKRITVSSVGLAKGLSRFIDESRCHLAISLHNPFPEERARLMPAESAFSIVDVVRRLENYEPFRKGRNESDGEMSRQRRLSFEYIVFAGVNDSLRHARGLVDLLRNLDCRVNLIRFHPIPGTELRGVDDDAMLRFRDYLTGHGLFTTIRASRGQDIFAACGLLSTAKQEGRLL